MESSLSLSLSLSLLLELSKPWISKEARKTGEGRPIEVVGALHLSVCC
jgi:hypothetical protein